MSYLQALLLSEAHALGHGVRSALKRHRHLTPRPLAMALWQLGAEPFTVGALAWGFQQDTFKLAVPGEPRNRSLTFQALEPVARRFNEWFEEEEEPQLVIANAATLKLLGRLGRRLAFLSTIGPDSVDPCLVRFGRHLRFLTEHALTPGQQLVVVLTDLLNQHWVCELSALEAQHLGALDAAIEPPHGQPVLEAISEAEHIPVGPLPLQEDYPLSPLIDHLNQARGDSSDLSALEPLIQPIKEHYHDLITRGAWPLIWRCLERERQLPEAPSAQKRWEQDLAALERHLDWMAQTGGIRRARHSARQAAYILRGWEEKQRLLESSEALDDRLKMLPHLLKGEGFFGRVVERDDEHRETPKKKSVRRPLITVELDKPCLMPLGKQLYWSELAKKPYTLLQSSVTKEGKGRVVLRFENDKPKFLPPCGAEVTFSIHHLNSSPPLKLPSNAPWTHEEPLSYRATIEDEQEGAQA